MKIGVVTYNKNPYRMKQFKEFTEINNHEFKFYYCRNIDRKWKVNNEELIKEKELNIIFRSNRFGYLNSGLIDIVKNNDLILIGGYEQLTYIFLSVLCRIYKKSYVLIFDGISCNKLKQKKNSIKYMLKKIVIKNSKAIFGNGKVSRIYFKKNFGKKDNEIYNQYLTIDSKAIIKNNNNALEYRKYYRKKYGIDINKKVIFYSGRVIRLKNIDSIIEAISRIKNKDEYVLFIAGGGEEEENIKVLAKEKKVNIIITGFIKDQGELFKHYYLGDIFTLMSVDEAWGLVVNEAMYAKLPIVLSNRCGSALDLIKENKNGFSLDPVDINGLKECYINIFNMDLKSMGEESFNIIKEWSFENSRKELEKLLKNIN